MAPFGGGAVPTVGAELRVEICRQGTFVAGGDIASFDDPAFTAAPLNRFLARLEAQERPVSLFSLDGHPHLRPYRIDPPDLRAYAGLKGASA